MIGFLIGLVLGLLVGALIWPAIRPLYEMALQRLYQRLVTWRMKRKERREQQAQQTAAQQAVAMARYDSPPSHARRTHSLRARREMTKRSRQQHRDQIASLQKLKQRRNKGRIPLHVRVAPKGWRREEAA